MEKINSEELEKLLGGVPLSDDELEKVTGGRDVQMPGVVNSGRLNSEDDSGSWSDGFGCEEGSYWNTSENTCLRAE